MTEKDGKPRKYKRINDEEGARARALWATGAATLEEIAAEIGVSPRALQDHFKAHGVAKGSEAHIAAKRILTETLTEAFGDQDDRVRRGKSARAKAFSIGGAIEKAIGDIVTQIAEDPASAFRFSAPLKSLDTAAAALERVAKLRMWALGITPETLDPEEMPTFCIHVITDEEAQEMRRQQEEEEADRLAVEGVDYDLA